MFKSFALLGYSVEDATPSHEARAGTMRFLLRAAGRFTILTGIQTAFDFFREPPPCRGGLHF